MDLPDDPPVVVMIYMSPRAPRTATGATRTTAGSHTAPRAETTLGEGGSYLILLFRRKGLQCIQTEGRRLVLNLIPQQATGY